MDSRNKAYILNVQKNEAHDLDYDAYLIPFENSEFLGARIMGIQPFKVSRPIYFLTDFIQMIDYDYIDNEKGVPLLSNRLLKLLQSKEQSNLSILPVTLVSDCYLDSRFDKNGTLKSDVPFNSNFSLIQLQKFTDVFDAKNSEYDIDEDDGEVEYIDKLVLTCARKSFPPIFKIKEDLTCLFVNGEVKEAIELAGLKGCVFEEVEVSK